MNIAYRSVIKNPHKFGYFTFRFLSGKNDINLSSTFRSTNINKNALLGANKPEWNSCRYSYSFFSRTTAEQLWKGVTSVSSAGRRKGRGKRASRKLGHDLNRGQVIGFGKINMVWPGLNAPIIRGKEVITQQELPPDTEREKRILEIRNQMNFSRKPKVHPLERGWAGTRLPGKSLGPPDPIGEETFKDFDSRVLQFKTVMKMSGQRGRVRRFSAFVVVGNQKGLAGYGLSKSVNGMTAAKNAKNRAAQALRYIERDKDHTVLHDFHSCFGANHVFVKKKPEGFGLVCHRAIREICKMVGIKDLYAKCEGPTQNTQNLTKAFFIGLMQQKPFHEMAEEKGLHLIEFRKDRDNYPELIASPLKCRKPEEIKVDETTNFRLYINEGKVEEERKLFKPFYSNFPTYLKAMKIKDRYRNHHAVKVHLLATYGEIKSFVQIKEEEKAKQNIKDTVES